MDEAIIDEEIEDTVEEIEHESGMHATQELLWALFLIDGGQAIPKPRVLWLLLSHNLCEAHINRVREYSTNQISKNEVKVADVDFGLDLIVMEVIEHVPYFIKTFIVTL